MSASLAIRTVCVDSAVNGRPFSCIRLESKKVTEYVDCYENNETLSPRKSTILSRNRESPYNNRHATYFITKASSLDTTATFA